MDREEIERQVLFPDLVYNEQGEPAEVVYIGGLPHYAIPDAGFRRHVEAFKIDSAVLGLMKEQFSSMEGEMVRGMLQMLGTTDLFTKAALEASLRNFEQTVRQSNTDQWVPWLRLFGFRIVVDVHGNVVELIYPTEPQAGEGDE